MNKFMLPLKGKEITEEVIKRQKDTPKGLELLAQKFLEVYRILPKFSEDLCNDYRKIALSYSQDPGKVVLLLGGGRARGDVLKPSSDIDLYFFVENIEGSIDPYAFFPSFFSRYTQDYRPKREGLLESLKSLIIKYNIRVPVDIRSYGNQMPSSLELTDSSIPLGISNL